MGKILWRFWLIISTNDIEKVFPDEICENFGFREVKFLLTNAGELFANNEKYGKMLIAEVK